MISLTAMLHKQNLIAQKSNLQMQMLNNSARQRSLLSNLNFCGNLEYANTLGTALELENISNSTQLMAINAELNSINNALKDSKLNYFA